MALNMTYPGVLYKSPFENIASTIDGLNKMFPDNAISFQSLSSSSFAFAFPPICNP
jgi:hypothetical protein